MKDKQLTLIRGKHLVTVNANDEIFEDGLVAVEGDRIIDVGPYQALAEKYRNAEHAKRLDYPQGMILPGLVSNHTHTDQCLMRSIGCHLSMEDWVVKVVYQMGTQMGREENYDAARLNMLEMISNGTTCFADSHFVNYAKDGVDGIAQAMAEMGMRGYLSRGTINEHPYPGIPDSIIEDVELVREEAIRCIETYHRSQNQRIRVSVEPICVTDCSEEMMLMLYGLAEQYDTMFQIHAVETYPELCTVRGQYGYGEIEYLERRGMLSERTLLIHSIWISAAEKMLIAQRRAKVNHNPVGNMLLGDGVAPILDLLALGVDVGLGVDGSASNNNQDMVETMKTCALLHRNASLDAKALTAYQVLKLATIGSAKTLHWDDEIGSLEPGKKADLIVVDLTSPAMTPDIAPVNNFVFAGNGRDVSTVMIDGQLIMDKRIFLQADADEIIARANRSARRMAKAAGVYKYI